LAKIRGALHFFPCSLKTSRKIMSIFNGIGVDPDGPDDLNTVPKSGEALKQALEQKNFKLEDLYEQCDGWFYDDDAASCKDEVIKHIGEIIKEKFKRQTKSGPFRRTSLLLPVKNDRPNGFVKNHFRDRSFEMEFARIEKKLLEQDRLSPEEMKEVVAMYSEDKQRWPLSALFYIVYFYFPNRV
jgi:hypothetical protein